MVHAKKTLAVSVAHGAVEAVYGMPQPAHATEDGPFKCNRTCLSGR